MVDDHPKKQIGQLKQIGALGIDLHNAIDSSLALGRIAQNMEELIDFLLSLAVFAVQENKVTDRRTVQQNDQKLVVHLVIELVKRLRV